MELSWSQPYPGRRSPVLAENIVACSQPLAAAAGLEMLRAGGGAIDAIIAAAAALTVVEPTSNGLGGDAFALVWDGELLGLNSSGRAPAAWSPERFSGLEAMPEKGWDSVTVPGAVAAWVALAERASLPLTALLAPAIRYAREGFLVSPIVAEAWGRAAERFRGEPGFDEAFLPGGRAPRAGERFANPALARSLELIAESGGRAFYEGELAEAMLAHSASLGGVMSAADLSGHVAERVTPLSVGFRGHEIHELPPNGQGLAALIGLGILESGGFAEDCDADSIRGVHLQVEACRRGLQIARAHIGEPEAMSRAPLSFLEPSFLAAQARLIDPRRAAEQGGRPPDERGTVYLCAADAGGRMASYIQSNYFGFGSGLVVPGTGIAMQNRGRGFVLEPGHANRVGGGKRPFHTIIPGFVTRGGAPVMAFGVMGGPMQAQGHIQLAVRILGQGQNPQAAIDAPRWFLDQDGSLGLEPGFSPALEEGLRALGHRTTRVHSPGRYGGAQAILRLASGYAAGSDPRKDGAAYGF